jgi:hypothetical protein
MELISSLLAALCAFLGAITAHFVAHDAYSKCPRYAHKLIQRAARMLSPLARKRYEEEWLAHLQECDGVFAKLQHAFECLLCARKLAASTRPPQPIEYKFGTGEKVSLNLATGVVALIMFDITVKQIMRLDEMDRPLPDGLDDDLKLELERLCDKYSYLGDVDGEAFSKFLDALHRAVFEPNKSPPPRITGLLQDQDLFAELSSDFSWFVPGPDDLAE